MLKEEGDALLERKDYDLACAKYFAAISKVKEIEENSHMNDAKDIELHCRGNISLCKLTLEDYDSTVE